MGNDHGDHPILELAGYLAGLTSGDVWDEAGKAVLGLFGADIVGFIEPRTEGTDVKGDVFLHHFTSSDGKPGRALFSEFAKRNRTVSADSDIGKELMGGIKKVLESGLPASRVIGGTEQLALGLFPVIRENGTVIMLAGNRTSAPLKKKLLDGYLAAAGLIGVTAARLAPVSKTGKPWMFRVEGEKGTSVIEETDGLLQQEVNGRHRVEEELKIEKDRVQRYLDLAGGMFVALDRAGEITLVNRKGSEVLGYTPEEIIGRNWFDSFLPERTREKMRDVFFKMMAGTMGPVEYYENPVMVRGGEERIVAWHNAPLVDEEGDCIGTLSSGEDITVRKRAEEEVRKRLDYERLLFEISSMDEEVEDLDRYLWDCLEIMGGILDISRIYIFEHHHDTNTMDNTIEWVSPGITPQKEHLQDIPDEAVPWWMEMLKNNRVINYRDVEEIPGDQEREILRNQEIKSILVVPLFVAGIYYGFMGFDECHTHREWQDEDVELLQSVSRIITGKIERTRAGEALRESERQKNLILNSMAEMVAYYDTDLRIVWANRASGESVGRPPEELVGLHCYEIWNERYEPCEDCPLLEALKERAPRQCERTTPDGRHWFLRGYPVFDEIGDVVALVEFCQDITEKKQAEEEKTRIEEQFHQSQKLESIGRLAGGVAHDLNNLLTPILGYGEMLWENTVADDPGRDPLAEIVNAGRSARDLVHQLLAFSRRQTLQFKSIDLNDLLSNFVKLLRHTIREDITINLDLGGPLPHIKGDAGQLEQVIMNLTLNAQDAMPDGGMLTIKTAEATLDEEFVTELGGIGIGVYVMLAVIDTGCGMDEETLPHLFEPFFTTKEKDRGTGLGLATVYGIVKQHDGSVRVMSEPGKGSTFEVYLPVSGEFIGKEGQAAGSRPQSELSGSETILLVEDNEQVRDLTLEVLKQEGYEVFVAESGKAAIELLDGYEGPVHLILTDVVMPGMNGRQLFKNISVTRPDVKVLYMSGYSDEVIAHHGVVETGVYFIQKPFSVKALVGRVRDALEGS